MTEELKLKDIHSIEELEKLIIEQDPDYKPSTLDHPWRKVKTHTEFPELKNIVRGKTIEYQVLDTHVNLEWLLKKFNILIRYNKMTRKREVYIPGQFIFKDDPDNYSLSSVEYISTVNYMPDKKIDKHLDMLAAHDSYHPIVECVESKSWDGCSRIDDLIDTLNVTNPDLHRILVKTWLIAAIASAYTEEGFMHHGVLVLQGEQGIGKTSWIKSLNPIKMESIKTGALLDPKNKDSIIGLSRFWIVELGELDATLNKTDIAHLKSFITNNVDYVRVPWGRKETNFIRRTSYIATVNSENFLIDDTGNRRWWTVSCGNIDYDHKIDMQQVWAEARMMQLKGDLTHLSSNVQVLLNEHNKKHEFIDPLKELLLTNYDWSVHRRREMTTTEILLEIGRQHPTKGDAMKMSKLLMNQNNKKGRRSNGLTLHEIPPKKFKTY